MTPPARRRGFTLLEVMAAVLVLGLIYTVLAEAAIRGLRSEGISRRRVEASLIADRFLADLESQVELGEVPTSGEEQHDVDVYHVGIRVEPFDPTPMLDTIAQIEKQRSRPDRKKNNADQTKASSMEVGAPTAGAPTEDLLAKPRSGEDGRLRRIDVAVTWQDGDREQHVLRTTFAFDTTGLDQLFPDKTKSGDQAAAAAAAAKNTTGLPPGQTLPPPGTRGGSPTTQQPQSGM
ncbi:MAG TPA: prepilin-type N-terminal cleavage/methylation domain-containing protein [Myxococcota bacterium]|nr:prepilin-type N-terminal cleavage/methylation domain-containing protein [Myxococcota bacterium]